MSINIHRKSDTLPESIKVIKLLINKRIIDGNCLPATDPRLEALKPYTAKALPGKSLVVLDPDLRMAIDVFLCEDGHAL